MTRRHTTMDRMPEKIDSKFRFVLLAAERAQQMMKGGRPKLDLGELKSTRAGMEEVLNDVMEWDYGPAPDPEEIEGEEEAEVANG